MNEVILETMKETDDKFWYVQQQIDNLAEILFKRFKDLEERIREIEGPPIPKPNPKHTPGRVELREMLISICKDVYRYWPRNQDEMERYEVFKTYMIAKGWDYLKHSLPEIWAQEYKFKNHEMEEALRILGVME